MVKSFGLTTIARTVLVHSTKLVGRSRSALQMSCQIGRTMIVGAVTAAIALTALAGLLEPLASGRAEPAAVIIDAISIAGERIRLLDIDAPKSFYCRARGIIRDTGLLVLTTIKAKMSRFAYIATQLPSEGTAAKAKRTH